MIDGNVNAVIQVKADGVENEIGERLTVWNDVYELTGWLDLSSGESKYLPNNAKIQESTHVFIADYTDLIGVTSENARLLINGLIYDITLIDDPMGLGQHLEIYLKFTGGQI